MKLRKIIAGMSALALAGTMALSASAAGLKTVKGTAEEKTEFWNDENSYFIDTTGIDRSKVDKIVVEYTADAIWCNGKLAGNLNLDKETSSGNWKGFEWTTPKGGESGECLVWDMKDGQPQYNDNPVSGDNFKVSWDVDAKKGSIEWSGIIAQGGLFDGRYSKGTKKYDKADDTYSASEGDAAGVVLQIGSMSNNPVVPDSEKNNPDFKATSWTPGSITITSVKFLDKSGNAVGSATAPAASGDSNTGDTGSDGAAGSDSNGNSTSTSNGGSGSTDNGGSASTNNGGSSAGNETSGVSGNTSGVGSGTTESGSASGASSNPGTGAASGAALAGIAIAGAALVLSKKKK